MDEVIQKAHAGGCKVVLSVKRFAWKAAERATTIALLSSANARARLAEEIADAVVARGVDGINLDFEPIPVEVKYDFVTFVRLVRSELDEREPGLSLTFDATGYITNYRIAELTAEGAADAVFVMGYPYKGSRSKRAGAVAPLDGVGYGLQETVDAYLARTTADKVILGLPYYGYEWSTETKYRHSRTRPAGPTYGYPNSDRIGAAIDLGALHGRRWDPEQLVAWTRWRYQACPSCPWTWRQLYYDDVESLGLKYDMVLERGLRGVGLFKIGSDAGHPELNDLLQERFGAS
jgi:spore germination protein YaaH